MCYLYNNQTRRSFTAAGPDQLNTEIGEGFGDVDELEESSSVATHTMDQDKHFITVRSTDPDTCSDEDEVIIIFQNQKLIMLWLVMLIKHTVMYTCIYSHSKMKLLRMWMTRQLTTGVSQDGRRLTGCNWLEHFLNLKELCVTNAG